MDTPGKRIVKWREHLGLKPNKFAEATGIPYTTLKTIESDSNKPSYDVLAKLRKAFPLLNIDWLFDEGDIEPMLRGGRNLAPLSTQSNELAEPAAVVPALSPTVRRKLTHPLMTADPDLSHLTPEEQAAYWKARYNKEVRRQAEAFEAVEHQETLQLIGNGPSFSFASSESADLYATVDALAFYYPAVSEESLQAVRSLARFKPQAPVIPMYAKPGFQQQAAGR